MSTYDKMYEEFKNEFFAGISLGILVASILGGVAAMSVLMHGTGIAQMLQLVAVVTACMLYNGSVLSQQKPKTIFNMFLLSVAVNVVIATFNFIQ